MCVPYKYVLFSLQSQHGEDVAGEINLNSTDINSDIQGGTRCTKSPSPRIHLNNPMNSRLSANNSYTFYMLRFMRMLNTQVSVMGPHRVFEKTKQNTNSTFISLKKQITCLH